MPRQTRRGRRQDRKRHARYKPRKRFKKGLGGEGDWKRRRYRI